MKKFLLLEISLTKFNANSGFYTVGLPALTAFAGFFHNIQRKIDNLMETNEVEGDLKIKNYAILAKNINLREGHPKYIKALKSSEKLTTSASTVDEKVADGDFCFIIRYEEDIDSSYYSEMNNQTNDFAQLFEKLLGNMKLAGGHFNIKNLKVFNDFETTNNHIKHKSYFYLVDKYDDLEGKNFDDYIKMISKCSLKENSSLKERPIRPYYIPIVPGFNLLENPQIKEDSVLRNKKYPHSFAEPILSLARLQSVYSVMHQYKSDIELSEKPKIFWDYKVENNFYYVAADTINF